MEEDPIKVGVPRSQITHLMDMLGMAVTVSCGRKLESDWSDYERTIDAVEKSVVAQLFSQNASETIELVGDTPMSEFGNTDNEGAAVLEEYEEANFWDQLIDRVAHLLIFQETTPEVFESMTGPQRHDLIQKHEVIVHRFFADGGLENLVPTIAAQMAMRKN